MFGVGQLLRYHFKKSKHSELDFSVTVTRWKRVLHNVSEDDCKFFLFLLIVFCNVYTNLFCNVYLPHASQEDLYCWLCWQHFLWGNYCLFLSVRCGVFMKLIDLAIVFSIGSIQYLYKLLIRKISSLLYLKKIHQWEKWIY